MARSLLAAPFVLACAAATSAQSNVAEYYPIAPGYAWRYTNATDLLDTWWWYVYGFLDNGQTIDLVPDVTFGAFTDGTVIQVTPSDQVLIRVWSQVTAPGKGVLGVPDDVGDVIAWAWYDTNRGWNPVNALLESGLGAPPPVTGGVTDIDWFRKGEGPIFSRGVSASAGTVAEALEELYVVDAWLDCNGNGTADQLDAGTTSPDCNQNQVPDECDISTGASTDFDGNGVPDDCVAPALYADTFAASLSGGASQAFTFAAPSPPAANAYLLLGTLSGTFPGTPAGSSTLPLNADFYFFFTLQNANSAVLKNTFGTLLPDGTSAAPVSVELPAGLVPELAYNAMHHAYVVVDLTGTPIVAFASNAVPLLLLP